MIANRNNLAEVGRGLLYTHDARQELERAAEKKAEHSELPSTVIQIIDEAGVDVEVTSGVYQKCWVNVWWPWQQGESLDLNKVESRGDWKSSQGT